MDAINLVGSSTENKRRELDFYPTPPDVTHALMKFLQLQSCYSIWEPACGDGAMSEVLKQYVKNVYSSDIRKTGYGDGGIDFLSAKDANFDAVITNPPFAISEDFIRRALGCASVVAMLLKSQYWHAKKRMKLFNEYMPAYVLPLSWRPDFLGKERRNKDKKNSPVMEVCWTVWIGGDTDTKYRILGKGAL
jgi:hypothetical protein